MARKHKQKTSTKDIRKLRRVGPGRKEVVMVLLEPREANKLADLAARYTFDDKPGLLRLAIRHILTTENVANAVMELGEAEHGCE